MIIYRKALSFIIFIDDKKLFIESSIVPSEGRLYYQWIWPYEDAESWYTSKLINDELWGNNMKLSNRLEFLLCFGCTIDAFLEAINQRQSESGWIF